MSVDVAAPVGGRTGPPVPRPAHVVAVLVVHDGAAWLPRTLAALAESTRRPDLVVAVDAGSTDRSGVLLDTAVGSTPVHVVDAVVTGQARDGFGTSVARGLAVADRLLAEAAAATPTTADVGERWVWLLHDDSAPEPEALDELLSVVQASPTLAVAGCKQRGWDDPRTLVEVGATVSRGGRRLTDLGPGDLDQGQHDHRADVLLVSTAGMLVRRTVLDHVGGFDPAIPLVGDDVDLCLRVRRAGHRVAVVPTAAVRHASALERGVRPADALHGRIARRLGMAAPRAGHGSGLEDARRRHWLHARLVQAPVLLVPLLWLWVVTVTPVRAVVWFLRGRPARALAELLATGRLLARSWRVTGSRWRSRRSRAVPAATLRSLQRSRSQVAREDLDAWRARRSLRRTEAATDDGTVPIEALESGPVDDETIDLDLGASGPARRFFGHPLTYLLPLTLAVGALPLLRALQRPGPVDADGMAVAVEDPTAGLTAVELASRAASGWRDVGTGLLGAADPATTVWAGLTGLVSLLTRGGLDGATVGDARTVLVLLAPALALLLAYPVARGLLGRRATAAGAATAWALLPATGLLGEVHAGDLLVHALLPVLLAATLGCLGSRPVNGLAATGLLSGLVVALQPGTWPVLVLVAVLVGVVGGSRVLASWRACLPLVGVAAPALLWAGWVSSLRPDPRALLLDPSSTDPTLVPVPTAAGLTDTALRARDLLSGATGPLGDPAALLAAAALALLGAAGLLTGVLVVAALARTRVPAAWCALAVSALAAATGVAAVLTARATGAEPSVPASAAALGLGLAAVLGMRDVRPRPALTGARARARALLQGTVTAGRLLVPAAAVVVAVAVGALVPAVGPPPGLPSPALVGSQSPQATRTLLLGGTDLARRGADAVLAWSVTAGQPGPGQASVQTALAAPERPVRTDDRRLADVVASALGDGSVPGSAVAGALAELGVGWVVVTDRPDVDTALAQRAGLVRTAQAAERTTWRVDSVDAGSGPVAARARLESAAGEDLGLVDLRDGSAELPSGEPGRLLVLAESARDSWSARLDGTALTRTTVGGWAQGFLLPADGGEVVLEEPGLPLGWHVVPLVSLGLLVLALLWPGRRHRARLDLDRGRGSGASVVRSRRARAALAGGRVLAAAGATAVVVVLLALATGVGVGPGRVQADRALAGAALDPDAPAPLARLGSALLAPADTVLDRVRPPDPVAAAPVVRLASAGAVQTCPAPGVLAEGVVDAGAADGPDLPDGAELRGLTLLALRGADDRGLRLASCPRTATSSWVPLGGTGVGEEPRLLLANPGETGAVVDVRLGGPDGPLVTPASTGILVGPGEQAEVAVDALAPDQPALLAHVVARVGTVAVTGTGSSLAGLVPLGGDAQTAQTVPGTALVLPWVRAPEAGGSARLLVGSVGDEPAVVRVRLVPVGGAGETPVPGAPTDPVVAPAGGVVDVDLSGLAGGDYAVHLDADVPVVASWTWTQQRAGEPAEGLTGVPVDRAWVQAVPADAPWRSAVVVPLGPLAAEPGALAGTTAGLVGAGDVAGRARVAVLDADGAELASRAVDLPAGGAPVGLPLPALLEGLDPALAASVQVTSAAGVHVGLRTVLEDADGELVAGTSVRGPQPATSQVRLLRER